jgi:Leucine-rich repeat (LRR) protein
MQTRIAAALDYLREHNHFREFDNQERLIRVGISEAENVDEIAAHIGSLRDLRELMFDRTGVSDVAFSHLANLVNLKDLSIDGSGFTSVGLAHLGAMSSLENLYLRDARDLNFAGFAGIASAPSLRTLNLHGGRFSDADLAPLSALVNLEELSLYECNQLDGTFCKDLIGLRQLKRLSFGESDGQISDEALRSIGRILTLNHLSLTGPFTDAGLGCLAELKNLTFLFIQSDQVTAKGVAVAVELPKLEHLYFDGPLLNDDVIPALLRCSMLERMSFHRSALSDAGLQQLRDGLPKCSVEDDQRDPYEFGQPGYVKDPDCERFEDSTPFLTLLANACDVDLVNGTFHKIGERYGHWVDATQYTPEERVVMLVWHSSGIIDNGGFEYLFAGDFDGDPDYHITAEAYKTAGLLRGFEAFQEAFALFPDGKVPHERAERDRLYDAANHSARYRLNRKLWQDGSDRTRDKRLAEFIRKNAARLGDLDEAS